MVTVRLLGNWLVAAVIGALAVCCSVDRAWAGETAMYLRSGWFSWDESVNGSSFVKERGWMHAVGITRRDDFALISLAERFEVWGGNLDYDGHDVTGSTEMKSHTSYVGTREEVSVSKGWPAAGKLMIEPLLGLGHKFWLRSRSDEQWNTFYAKAGAGGELNAGGCKIFVKGGAILPIYTRNHASLSSSGYTDVVTEPGFRPSAFAEGGVVLGSFAVSIDYEGMNFGQSEKVATSRITPQPKGVEVASTMAYQPPSSSSFVSLKLTYRF